MMTFIFEIVIDPKSLRSSSKCPQLINQRITIFLNFLKKCIRPFFYFFHSKKILNLLLISLTAQFFTNKLVADKTAISTYLYSS